jgi:hypothetical protein
MTSAAFGALTDKLSKATNVLVELLDSENEGVRIAAVRTMLQYHLAFREAIDVDSRLTDLERKHHLRTGRPAEDDADVE